MGFPIRVVTLAPFDVVVADRLGRNICRKSRENTRSCMCCVATSEPCTLSRRSFTFLIVATDRTSLTQGHEK